MNTFIYLLIGHFYADYPFQSSRLAEYKKKNVLGVIVHAGMHFITSLIVFYPLLGVQGVWVGLVTVFITHGVIDQTKIFLNKRNPLWTLPLYFIDQATHIGVAYLISRSIGVLDTSGLPSLRFFYQNDSVALFILLLPVVTYFYDVTRQIIRHHKGVPFKRDYQMMVQNAIIVTAAFAMYWLS